MKEKNSRIQGFVSERRTNRRRNLSFTIGGIFFGSTALFVAIMLPITVNIIKNTSQSAVEIAAGKHVEGALNGVQSYLELLYGSLQVRDSQLLGDEKAVTEESVDMISKKLGMAVTVFSVENGNEFKRIFTTIKNREGKRAIGTYLERGEAYNALVQKKPYRGTAKILGEKFLTKYLPVIENNSMRYVLFSGISIAEANASVRESLNKTLLLIISMSIAGLFIMSAVGIVVVKQIVVKPIAKMVLTLYEVGEGDLTARLSLAGNSEITDFSEYFNRTLDKMGITLKAVHTDSNKMEEIGNELAANMTETASAVHQISINIDDVKQQALNQAASVSETATTIEEIVRTIQKLNDSIEIQSARVTQSSAAIEEMVANIASIGQTLSKTDEAVKDLTAATDDGKATIVTSNSVTQKIAEESGSLLEASSVIQHIASQTNLLAMNAAIEAAHAGEAGKGFAVVADEIRKLAENSARQGKAITSTLKTLSGEIEVLSSSSKTVEDKFNIIFNLAEQVKLMSARLTEAMNEQEQGSREVLEAIKEINLVTTEVRSGSEKMLKGGEEVSQEMQKLDHLTHSITESMNEMACGAVQINNAVQEVNEITQKNKASIENLASEVAKFKV